MNLCVFGGNLVRDPELRAVGTNGNQVTSFSIALRGFKKDSPATFIDCEAWNTTAELIEKNFKKGNYILVQANARQDTWEDKDSGAKRSKIKFVVERLEFTGGAARKDKEQASDIVNDMSNESDIPF